MNKRETGSAWEQRAAEYMQERGMLIRERNYRNRQGEIDIIGNHDGYLVFVEVKFRSGTAKGYALQAVDRRKQRQICKVADYYRYVHGLGDNVPVRYDVLAIQGEEIQWVQNAFPHIYSRGR